MSLPVPTNPVELLDFRRRARRLVDVVSDLVRHGPHRYAAFQARVYADRPARDNGWDHFVDVCLQQMLARDPHPYNAPDIQVQFAAGTVPFGVHLLNRLFQRLQDDLWQLEDAQRRRLPMGPLAGWPGYAAPGAFPMLLPRGLGPLPFPPFGAHHHHQLHLHHLLYDPVQFPMMHHHFPHQHVHPAVPQLAVHLHHHHHPAAVPQLPVHVHHHHHHHRPHQHVVYPHPLPQRHPRPPQHAVLVPVPVPVPAPGRGAQQLGVSQGEARGVPPGEAGRTGAQATAPPLAVPQPGHTTAGSPPRTVPVPDPAVPCGPPPVVPTGPAPVVPGGSPSTHGVQGAAPMGRPTAGEQAGDAAQEAAAAGPRDISELLAQALGAYRRTAAGGHGAVPEAPGREADVGELIAQALMAVAPRAEGAKEKPSEVVASGGQDVGRGVPEAQAPAVGGGVVEPSGGRAKGEAVEDWMWEWREWRQVAPGELCPAGLAYSMDLHAGTSWARLPDNLRARLDAAEAARGGGADERPLAPFLPRPDMPPVMIAAGEEAEEEQEADDEEDEEVYGPGKSPLALMYDDDTGPDVYAGMDVDPANATLRPMPTVVPPPPLGSCEQRHCRYHAAEGANRHRLMGTGQREAGMLASALERYELQRQGQVAREMALLAASPDDGQVRCVQLGNAAVLGHQPGDVRAAESQEGLPLSVRLSVGRLLDEAGLEDVRRDEGVYVALRRGGADTWRREQAMRPLTPQALGSHALLVAVHPEGAEVVFGADRLLLTGDGVVLVPTSSSYRLESRGSDLKLLVVVGTRLDESAALQGSEHAVPVGSDEDAGRDRDEAGQEHPTREEQQQGQPEVAGEEVDVQAIVAAALARFTAAASPPPTTEALEEEDQRRRSEEAQVAMESDEEREFMGTKEAPHEVGPRGLGVADKAGPKMGEVKTCSHWAKGWCMRADACRYAHPEPPVTRGVPQELLLILQAMARVGALSLDHSQSHGRGHRTLLQKMVVKAQGGGLPAVGYAVKSGGLTEWAVALPCGMAALLTPFPVVPWRDMVTVQEANLGWVCTWHTHPAGMDPRQWQAKAVMTYLSWSLSAAPGAWAQLWDRALRWARDGSAVAACPDLLREPVSVQPWTVSLHLPTVAARLAATDLEVLLLEDREGPGLRLGRGLEVRTTRLPCPVEWDILEGLQFTRADGADVWTAVHRRLPDAWPQVFRPPGHERLLGSEWRVWAASSPCPPVVVLPRRTSHPSWETVAVLWGWMAVGGPMATSSLLHGAR